MTSEINNTEVDCLLDTGALGNYMSEDTAKSTKVKLHGKPFKVSWLQTNSVLMYWVKSSLTLKSKEEYILILASVWCLSCALTSFWARTS